MNIFLRELKAHWKGLLGWSIAMVLLIVFGMAKFSALGIGSQNANQIFQVFPKSFQVIFGVQGLDLSRVIGYFGVLYLYIQLTAAIHAVMLGTEIISKEERDRTSEFLYPKPVTRMQVLTEKVLAGLVNIIVLNVVSIVTSIIMVAAFANNFLNNDMVIVLMTGIFMTQLLFFTLGIALAGYFKNPKLPSIVGTSILLATYIIWVIIDLNSKLDLLKYVTPFKYYDASIIIHDGYLDPLYLIISVLILTILMASSYLAFNKRDLKV